MLNRLLALPSELLELIALHAGPAAALRLSATCRHLHTLIVDDSDALWLAFLRWHNYPDHDTVPAIQAKQLAREWYCRQCDTIVGRNRMYYTGNICINCEFKYPSEVWAPEPMVS